jgi:hypothetical protein
MIRYNCPCSPGDEVWVIETHNDKPLSLVKDTVKAISFTTKGTQLALKNHQDLGMSYTWNKNVFATQDEALIVFAKAGLNSFKEET